MAAMYVPVHSVNRYITDPLARNFSLGTRGVCRENRQVKSALVDALWFLRGPFKITGLKGLWEPCHTVQRK